MIVLAVVALVLFCVSRLQASLPDPLSDGEWLDGKVLLTGKDIKATSTRYYGDCHTGNGIVRGRTGLYKNKKKIYLDKEYGMQYRILKNGSCWFRFTDPGIAQNEIHSSKGKGTLILSIICACLAVFIWVRIK